MITESFQHLLSRLQQILCWKVNLFPVYSGKMTAGSYVMNSVKDQREKSRTIIANACEYARGNIRGEHR